MPRERRMPKPASEATVRHAVREYTTAIAAGHDSRAEAVMFLDRLGFRNLDDSSAVLAFSDVAAHALRETLPLSLTLVHLVIERLSDIDPTGHDAGGKDVRLSIAFLWFAQCAGHAVELLPVDDRDSAAYLDFLAAAPLCGSRYGAAVRRAVVAHRECPADVLYTAALDWPLDNARVVATHPNATEEAQVAVALRT